MFCIISILPYVLPYKKTKNTRVAVGCVCVCVLVVRCRELQSLCLPPRQLLLFNIVNLPSLTLAPHLSFNLSFLILLLHFHFHFSSFYYNFTFIYYLSITLSLSFLIFILNFHFHFSSYLSRNESLFSTFSSYVEKMTFSTFSSFA